jgi:GrpB-like predicted nucleotidyltransferase (UPF0157 family)
MGMRKVVRISSYDASWPRRYDEEAAELAEALGSVAIEIEHIGSTSVPGLDAKPTIDILIGTHRLEIGEEATQQMEGLGYDFRGEAGVPQRRFFRKGATFPREFNVHVVELGGRPWQEAIEFRDYFRAHPETAQAYGALKRELVSTDGGAELTNYAAGKSAFIAEIVKRAQHWRR